MSIFSSNSIVNWCLNTYFFYKFPHIITSLKEINDKAKGIGSISRVGNTQGVLRKVPLLISMEGKIYPALSIEALRVHLKEK